METIRIAWSMGIVALAFSMEGLGTPPEGKGKRPPHAGPSPFIEFPVPQNSVGIMHLPGSPLPPGLQRKVDGRALKGKRADLGSALPMATSGFPSMRKGAPVPECISR